MKSVTIDAWVTADRLRVYAGLIILAYVIVFAWTCATAVAGVDAQGDPIGHDFITFYAASELGRDGRAAAAYDVDTIAAAERAAVPGVRSVFPWFYPPPYHLVVAPLGLAPYWLAFAGWVGATFAIYALLVRRLCGHPLALLVGAASPAVFLNAMHGQNGFLNVGLLGFGLLLLDRRPWVAGILLGLLVYKPHFGVLLPLLLLAQGRWKAIGGAALSATAFCGLSLAVYGIEPWLAFLENLQLASMVLEQRQIPWANNPSLFIAVAVLGASLPVAYGIHGVMAVILAALTCWAWRAPGPQRLKVALAIPAILAVTPYCFNYDLILWAIPIGLLAEYALRNPAAARGISLPLTVAFLAPVVLTVLAAKTPLHLSPLVNLWLFLTAWRLLAQERGSALLNRHIVDEPRTA